MKLWTRSETEPAQSSDDYISREIKALRNIHIETVGTWEYIATNEVFARNFCHALVEFMPREGLVELVKEAIEILRFHADRRTILNETQPKEQRFKAKITKTLTRPEFSISYDDE